MKEVLRHFPRFSRINRGRAIMRSATYHIVSLLGLLAALGNTAYAQNTCGHPHGGHVVINIRWGDVIGGLAVRDGPSASDRRLGIIPPHGAGVGVGRCLQTGWCEIRYECLRGWSMASRYLAPREHRLNKITGVRADDPYGLNMRNGPSSDFQKISSIPFNGVGVVLHHCEASPKDRSDWCLVTHGGVSGWVAGKFLTPTPAEEKPIIATLPAPPRTETKPPVEIKRVTEKPVESPDKLIPEFVLCVPSETESCTWRWR